MFEQWKQKRQKKKEERRQREERWKEIKEWDMQHYDTVSFCLQDVEFMGYYLPMNLGVCENTLSLYEATEKSFHREVCMVFREIVEELAEGYCVMQWLHWSRMDSLPANKTYQVGEEALFGEDYILKCTENGADQDFLELQLAEGNEWAFIEQECFCYREKLPEFSAVEDGTEYIEEVLCDLYIMLDLLHGALMVKTKKEEELKKVEVSMRKVCAKYEKEIHDYIGYFTQKAPD